MTDAALFYMAALMTVWYVTWLTRTRAPSR